MPTVADAGAAIMAVYDGGFSVQEGRQFTTHPSRLGIAARHPRRLEPADTGYPGAIRGVRPSALVRASELTRLWVVDPLDGTREFVKRNGEFTINIALVVNHEPLFGIVAAPALGLLYWGAVGVGAFSHHRDAPELAISVSPPTSPLRVVGSRSHASPETAGCPSRLGAHEMSGIGSSLKFCLIAEGKADLTLRFGPTSEWDTAAGQALLEAAGSHVTRLDGHRLRYNCRETLLNGDFLAFSNPSLLPTASSSPPACAVPSPISRAPPPRIVPTWHRAKSVYRIPLRFPPGSGGPLRPRQ